MRLAFFEVVFIVFLFIFAGCGDNSPGGKSGTKTYTVSFTDTKHKSISELPSQISARDGSSVTLPVLSAANNSFAGWKRSGAGNVFTGSYKVTGNVTLDAVWKGTITYVTHIGAPPPDGTYEAGEKIDLPVLSPSGGFTLVGWRETDDNSSEAQTVYTVDSNTTLYAVWRDVYLISFKYDNDTLIKSVSLKIGSAILGTEVPNVGEYAWYSGKWGQGKRLDSSTLVEDYDASFYPVFKRWQQGGGTQEEPFIIKNDRDLDNIRSYLSAYYKLDNDISLDGWNKNENVNDPDIVCARSETECTDGKGWLPIGDDKNLFTGTLSGGNHSISGLTIRRGNEEFVGLFGGFGGNISNLGISCDTEGDNYAGGVAGYGLNSIIENVYVTGDITGNEAAGGIIGHNYEGLVRNSYSTAGVSGKTRIGGIAGWNLLGAIENSYATGSVLEDVQDEGNEIGGIVGYSSGRVTGCAAVNMSVKGFTNVGKIAGYSVGPVSNNLAFDNMTITSNGSSGSNGSKCDDGTSAAITDFKTDSTYTGWDFGAVWQMGMTLPLFKWQDLGGNGTTEANAVILYNQWDLNYIRSNLNNHYKLGADINLAGWNSGPAGTPCSRSDTDCADGQGWLPIGGAADKFLGTLNGADHTVFNIKIDRPLEPDVAFIAYLSVRSGGVIDGVIKNINLKYGEIIGGENTGGLAGTNSGTIMNSYSSVNVEGVDNNTGGLVGLNEGGVIKSCITSGEVKGTDNTGGIAGNINGGALETGFSSAKVSGDNNTGGISGLNAGTIRNSYSTGAVTGSTDYTGGVTGRNERSVDSSYSTAALSGGAGLTGGVVGGNFGTANNPTIRNCMAANRSITGAMVGRISGNNININPNNIINVALVSMTGGAGYNGEDKTENELAERRLYETTLLWDFTNTPIWRMGGATDGTKYPVLR
ncbi:MAG: InlB B-repeat-containing protein [Deferribacteraceae bacterium]|jgi:hypothetical protein|nr:InlB B-repeat-containing protein [Deferribacteraceae bacterium]